MELFFHGEAFVQLYRRIEQVLLFDEAMGPDVPLRGGEDTDCLIRFTEMHGRAFSCPGVQVCHPRSPAMNDEKAVDCARARMHLFRKYRYPLWFKLLNVTCLLLRMLLERGRSLRL